MKHREINVVFNILHTNNFCYIFYFELHLDKQINSWNMFKFGTSHIKGVRKVAKIDEYLDHFFVSGLP